VTERSLVWALALIGVAGSAVAQPPAPRNGSLPFVSPDGRWIAFCADRGGPVSQIYVIGADGSGEMRLTGSSEDKHTPDWSTDSKTVRYGSERGDTTALCAVPAMGGPSRVLMALRAKTIALSSDGRRAAWTVGEWTRNRIVVGAVDGTGARAITDSSAGYFNIAWSPDARQLAVTRIDTTHDLQVWVMDADGSHSRALTHFPKSDGRPQWPAWSPDGKKVAIQSGSYNREHPELSDAYIWVIDVASGNPTRLTTHEKPRLDETPSWFPDGKRLAFQSDRTGRMEIWVMNADGTHQRQVTR
jgi:Tol biopolymer transport system component